ncbi:MAG: hypothetical protein HY822_00870 [Acidobacteria bacterium]|nr:hypothetical protein [Acidobacteriota bacterium]
MRPEPPVSRPRGHPEASRFQTGGRTMKGGRRILKALSLLTVGLSLAWTCAFDDSLREYLSAYFWLPFAKSARDFAREGIRGLTAPYAGMEKARGETPLARLRAAYQRIAFPESPAYDSAKLQQALATARSAPSLTPREREEVELIDAKIDMRAGSRDLTGPWIQARKKLNAFLQKARTPEYLSEARGWLAHIHYLLGEQTAAGKIYLDELNRRDSNLSRETLLTSLKMTYGYDGGPQILDHLEEYFDTPEHAAFAIQLATNPRWPRNEREPTVAAPPYARITSLLEKHRDLLRSERGTGALALLGMRAALRAGDPPAALRLAAQVPPNGALRSDPDFLWMLASAHFLTRNYASAEAPLLRLFRLSRSSDSRKAAAAYALCGVYRKTGNPVEQIRFALWLKAEVHSNDMYLSYPSRIEDLSVYWAVSGWDLALLLEAEAPIEALRAFADQYPGVPEVRLVKYSLAVRLARENRYAEAARIYEAVNAPRRAGRMLQLASLYRDANRADALAEERRKARYRLAEFLSANPERLYFNDALWRGLQRYAFIAANDGRLTRDERRRLMAAERKLKDDQEERWQAYLILREVVREAPTTELGREAALLARQCLRRIGDRFGRESEIRAADIELIR